MPSILSLDAISRIRKTPPLAFEQSADDRLSIQGYAYEWGSRDEHGSFFAVGGFSTGEVPALIAHNHHLAIGTAKIEPDKTGLWADITLKSEDDLRQGVRLQLDALSADLILPLAYSPSNNGTSEVNAFQVAAISLVASAKTGTGNKAAREPRTLGSKAELVDILREAGIPKAAAASIAARGWVGLASVERDAATDLANRISKFTQSIRSK